MRAGRWWWALVAIIGASLAPAPANAQSARDWLTQAGFVDRDRATALAHIDRADQAANAALAKSPGDEEALLMQAMALGYRAKLTSSRSLVMAARKQYEALVQRFPRSAEAQAALGAWHVGVIHKVGSLVGRVLGAQKSIAYASLDRAVTLSGNRAMLIGVAGLMRLQLDPDDPTGKLLVERATRSPAPTSVDVYVRRAAIAVLAEIKAGDDKAVKRLADTLLPFGQFS
ncbi:MAG: hypothetical protein OSB00_03090 [Sphingomonas bacterium]|nr:hypothetical protein [Sphingomonas bacterium]